MYENDRKVARSGKPFNIRKACTDHWYDIAVGSSEAHIAVNLVNKDGVIVVELYISDNKELFDAFFSHRADIETALGTELVWDRLDHKKASRIKYAISGLDFADHSNCSALMNQTIDIAVKCGMYSKTISDPGKSPHQQGKMENSYGTL